MGSFVSVLSSRCVLIKCEACSVMPQALSFHPVDLAHACSSSDLLVCVTFENSKEPSNLRPVTILLPHGEGKQTATRLLIMTLQKIFVRGDKKWKSESSRTMIWGMSYLAFWITLSSFAKSTMEGGNQRNGKRFFTAKNQFQSTSLSVGAPAKGGKGKISHFLYLRPAIWSSSLSCVCLLFCDEKKL